MIRVHVGEKLQHTHENIGLENFLERLEPLWGGKTEIITVVANALWSGAEIDAVCILPSAIVVIDFKNYGGRISLSENGPWQGDSGLVKGGTKLNPFAQVRDNKRDVINWLKYHNLLSACNLGHISGAVVFMKPVIVENDLGPKIGSWFHVTDLDRCGALLASISSPQITIDEKSVHAIIDALGVREYRSARLHSRVVAFDGNVDVHAARPKLTEQQQEVLGTIVHFLGDHERKSLSVLGMTHTGKTLLLQETQRELERLGRQAIVLGPNARLARKLAGEHGLDCSSIYTHVFDRSSSAKEKVHEGPSGSKRKVDVFPIRPCVDSEDCVYLIDEAHLIGNDYFELEDGKRFGSGRLFDDFISFSVLNESHRQVVLFGDPYQLPRGRRDAMPLFGDVQRARNLAATEITLAEVFEISTSWTPIANARRLAEAIDKGRFSVLQLESGEGFKFLAKREVTDEARRLFEHERKNCLMIAETHFKVANLNQWIRKSLFGAEEQTSVAIGELLEFYFAPDEGEDPFSEATRALAVGDRIVVQWVAKQSVKLSQSLSGRAEPITFNTRSVSPHSMPEQKTSSILEEFLLSEKPELDPELAIALEVWQKQHPDRPVSKARYGYASTCHHAQGFSHPVCFVNAGYDGGRHSDQYFRWLYTAITRAEQQCYVFNFQPLDPFDEAQWHAQSTAEINTLPIGGGWYFQRTKGLPTPGDTKVNTVREPDAAVPSAALGDAIRKLLEPLGWRVINEKASSYLQRFDLMGPDKAKAQLDVYYNKDNQVTQMRMPDATAATNLLVSLAEAAVLIETRQWEIAAIMQHVYERTKANKLRVVGAHRDGEFRLTVIFCSEVNERAQVEINHNKSGLVTSVRLIKHTGPHVVDEIRSALVPEREVA